MAFDTVDYEKIWQAPEGCEYAVQYKRPDTRDFFTYEIALPLNEARNLYTGMQDTLPSGAEIRVVVLSRYPPCSVSKVVLYREIAP
jgi:hypothetical protein